MHTLIQIAIAALLTGAVQAVGGCASIPRSAASPENYRTITASPMRDTEAAGQMNEVGLRHLANGELDLAAEAFTQSLNEDVEFGPAHNNLGKVYYCQGKYYKAAREFDYARTLLPKHGEPCNNLGLVWEDVGQLDEAIDCYREARRIEPGKIEYSANLARALVRRGDRTDEVRLLLGQLVRQDDRPEWRDWARRTLAQSGTVPQP